jgi:hypothetical protein
MAEPCRQSGAILGVKESPPDSRQSTHFIFWPYLQFGVVSFRTAFCHIRSHPMPPKAAVVAALLVASFVVVTRKQ